MSRHTRHLTTRRALLGQMGLAGVALGAARARARAVEVVLPLPSDPRDHANTNAFPDKKAMILQRTRQPL